MSAAQAEAGPTRSGPARAAGSAFRVVTAVVLLGIVLLLVGLVGQGAAGARGLAPSWPGHLGPTRPAGPPRGQTAMARFDAAQEQASRVLAGLQPRSGVHAEPGSGSGMRPGSSRASGPPPEASSLPQAPAPGDSGTPGDTAPRLAQMTLPDRQLRPRQRPGEPSDGSGGRTGEEGMVLSDALPPVGALAAAARTADRPAGGTAWLRVAQAGERPPVPSRAQLRASMGARIESLRAQTLALQAEIDAARQNPPARLEEAQRQAAEFQRQYDKLTQEAERLPKLPPFPGLSFPGLYRVPRPPADLVRELQQEAEELARKAEAIERSYQDRIPEVRSAYRAEDQARLDRLDEELADLDEQAREIREQIIDLQIRSYFLTDPPAGTTPQPPEPESPAPSPHPDTPAPPTRPRDPGSPPDQPHRFGELDDADAQDGTHSTARAPVDQPHDIAATGRAAEPPVPAQPPQPTGPTTPEAELVAASPLAHPADDPLGSGTPGHPDGLVNGFENHLDASVDPQPTPSLTAWEPADRGDRPDDHGLASSDFGSDAGVVTV